jgi:DNA primase
MARLTKEFKGKLHRYFQIKVGARDYRHGWMKSRCPYCGREGKFGINLSLNRCNCFRCGEHPSPINLVMYLEHVDTFQEVTKILSNSQYEGYIFKEEKLELKEQKPMILPDGFKSILFGNSQLAKAARNYVKKRGFDLQKVAMAGWGYGTKGKYFGYLIIPFHQHGELVYFNARLFMGNGPKYNNPDTTESGLGKSFIIYNKDALDIYRTVFICEGAINAETMGERGIASGGKAISRYQINEIIKSPVERVIILFDPDAKDRAIDLALKLVNFKKVKVIFLPEGTDCNDLGRKRTLSHVYKVHYQSYQELFKLKLKYCK